jgi:hypothetical protein
LSKLFLDGLDHDNRIATISMYLFMLVLFTTSLKSFFPNIINPADVEGLNSYAYLTAMIYGIDIVTVAVYFIYCQIGYVEAGHKVTVAYDIFLIFNLLLVTIVFMLTLVFTTYFLNVQGSPNVPSWFSTGFGILYAVSAALGLLFVLYPLFSALYDKLFVG